MKNIFLLRLSALTSNSPQFLTLNNVSVSGGPLLRAADHALIGITSFSNRALIQSKQEAIQVFTYIPYYFLWISSITKLELPECRID